MTAANPAASERCYDCGHDAFRCDQEAVADLARIRELEDRIQVLIHCDIAELKERIALMEQATCDFCGHKFYALEVDE